MSRLDLVATLGPASFQSSQELVKAGATALRLNGSHMSPSVLHETVRKVRAELPETPLIIDLQGAKMRLGSFEERQVRAGESLTFALRPGEFELPLPHPEIFRAVRPGDTLSLDDDRIRFRVERRDDERMTATALLTSELRPRRGVNVLEHPVDLSDLSETDIEQVERTATFSNVSFACSFIRDGREAEWIRARAEGARVIGKVERSEAIDALPELTNVVEAIWICRGDLGAQLGVLALAEWLSEFSPKDVPIPVLIAGQVLEHLTHHHEPTRSEVCHLHDLLQRGYRGVALSDETAIGHNPVRATAIARTLLDELGPSADKP